MYQLTNLITLLRGPIALFFLFKSPYIRVCAVLAALLTDIVDGYLARKFNQMSTFGAILDPIMDKIFVYIALSTFYFEQSISIHHILMMISRDLCILFVGLFFCFYYGLRNLQFHSILWGKITTGLQFTTIFLLCLQVPIPIFVYYSFLLITPYILFDLFVSQKRLSQDKL